MDYYSTEYPSLKVQGPSKMYAFEQHCLTIPDDDIEGIEYMDKFLQTAVGNTVRKLDQAEAEKVALAAMASKPLASQGASNSLGEIEAHMLASSELGKNTTPIEAPVVSL